MPKNKYKLSKLAQSHLQKIKSYTVDNFSEAQWRNYKEVIVIALLIMPSITVI